MERVGTKEGKRMEDEGRKLGRTEKGREEQNKTEECTKL